MEFNHEDHFDRIPDSIVLDIFNKVADVRSLGRCSAVSKRFNALVPLVHDVYVKIDRVLTIDGQSDDSIDPSSRKSKSLLSQFLKLLFFAFLKPFHQSRTLKGVLPQIARHSPTQVLKKFTHVQNLRIELPAGDVGTDDGVMLKWRAEFGSTLQSCVILGGTKIENSDSIPLAEETGNIPDSFYTNGGLKLRVVWTISSLIAASTRHHLLRPIIEGNPTIKSLVLTDADGQGTLSMGAEQLREFRENPVAATVASNRTQVPASNMKLRYAPFLELPEGVGMQGATLVAIRPSESVGKKEVEGFVSGAFEGPFKVAVKTLVKQKTYLLEMNGF